MKDETLLLLLGAGFLAYRELKKVGAPPELPPYGGGMNLGGINFSNYSPTSIPAYGGGINLDGLWSFLSQQTKQSNAPTLADYKQATETGRTVTTPTLNTQRWISAGANPRYATEEEAYFAGKTVSIEEVMARRNGNAALFNPQTQKIIQEPTTNVIHTEADAIRAGLVHLGTPIGTSGIQSTHYTPNTVIQREDGSVIQTDENGTIIRDTQGIINETTKRETENRLLGR